MKLADAKILSQKYVKDSNTLQVTSDGTIYVNGNIEAIEKHAKKQKLQVFYIKPEKETKKTK